MTKKEFEIVKNEKIATKKEMTLTPKDENSLEELNIVKNNKPTMTNENMLLDSITSLTPKTNKINTTTFDFHQNNENPIKTINTNVEKKDDMIISEQTNINDNKSVEAISHMPTQAEYFNSILRAEQLANASNTLHIELNILPMEIEEKEVEENGKIIKTKVKRCVNEKDFLKVLDDINFPNIKQKYLQLHIVILSSKDLGFDVILDRTFFYQKEKKRCFFARSFGFYCEI